VATPKNNSIGTTLRRLRVAAGQTQAQLAERATMADATISRIERGRLMPSVDLAQRLAAALDVSVGELLEGAVPAKATAVRPSVAKLVAVVRELDDGAVDDVTKAVRLLIAVGRRTAGPRRRPTSR
jgi:transcriptional regulator with XRE-family HTH domain